MPYEVIAAFLTGVLGPLLVLFVKYKTSQKKKPDILKECLEESKQIQSKLENIREEFNVDRIYIAQFHNGGNFYPTGKSLAKFSIMYEVVNVSVASIRIGFQNIPVNLFSRSINHLLEHDVIEIPDYKDETVATFGLKYLAEDFGCKSTYHFAIKSIDDKFIGILSMDFTKRKHKLTQEEVNKLRTRAATLGGVLAKKST
jgi:hypothetical protein